MKRVLCYGDSNTWGSATVPRPDDRYGEAERWPGVLAAALGDGWRVIEEGLSGRTTVHADPVEGRHLDGSAYLKPCLRSHRPLDAVVIMLGTNDLKTRFGVSPFEIGDSVGVLIEIAMHAQAGPGGVPPRLLLVCPPPILPHEPQFPEWYAIFSGGAEKSRQLLPHYQRNADAWGAELLDAGAVITSSRFDGIHLDLDAHAALGRAVAARLGRMFAAA
jgi:lysophospholipase L1-like esterase